MVSRIEIKENIELTPIESMFTILTLMRDCNEIKRVECYEDEYVGLIYAFLFVMKLYEHADKIDVNKVIEFIDVEWPSLVTYMADVLLNHIEDCKIVTDIIIERLNSSTRYKLTEYNKKKVNDLINKYYGEQK